MMIGIYYRYIHTPAGTKERLLTEKKAFHTHTHTASVWDARQKMPGISPFYIHVYTSIFIHQVCHTHTHSRAYVRICVVCMIVVF